MNLEKENYLKVKYERYLVLDLTKQQTTTKVEACPSFELNYSTSTSQEIVIVY